MWVPLFYKLSKWPFRLLIYIEMTFDLYINWKRFIYKSQTIYIFIVNSLYIDRYLVSHKPYFDLKKFVSSYFWLQNPFPFRCLFRIIPNSASLLKTFFARILGNSREAFAIPCLGSATGSKDLNLDCRMSRKGRVAIEWKAQEHNSLMFRSLATGSELNLRLYWHR